MSGQIEAAHEAAAIAKLLFFLPAVARTKFAIDLHALGLRAHPELAVKKLVSDGPDWLGNHAPQRLDRIDGGQAMRVLSQINPDLAAKVAAAQEDPAAAAELGEQLQSTISGSVDALRTEVESVSAEDLS